MDVTGCASMRCYPTGLSEMLENRAFCPHCQTRPHSTLMPCGSCVLSQAPVVVRSRDHPPAHCTYTRPCVFTWFTWLPHSDHKGNAFLYIPYAYVPKNNPRASGIGVFYSSK